MTSPLATNDELVAWFRTKGGTFDESLIGFTTFPACGRGAIALSDVPEGSVLFTLPRTLTLSTRTSKLPGLLGTTWNQYGLGKGWVGLILCMLWEEAQGAQSPWDCYLRSLPTKFDTPMFWTEEEINELVGTAVVDKIGKSEAEEDYHDKMIPAIRSRPDLFPPESIDNAYSLEKYHISGSRILSRSFTVQRWRNSGDSQEEANNGEPDEAEDDDEAVSQDEDKANAASQSSAGMDVDQDAAIDAITAEAEAGQDSDDEDDEDPSDVAMVPMADMLNARYGCENAKLFYEPTELRMIATKHIAKGDQIWNTYGDPPNSDLLRRYGHVDEIESYTNPADIVEIRADLVVSCATSVSPATKKKVTQLEERVEWWLDEGGDDVFVIETDHTIPDSLISFARLLLLDVGEWKEAQEKRKIPKPKPVDAPVLRVLASVLKERMEKYSRSLEDDEAALQEAVTSWSSRKRHALVVRVGEKRILKDALLHTEGLLRAGEGTKDKKSTEKTGKRKADKDESRSKRVRR